jgi:hypothetical protein
MVPSDDDADDDDDDDDVDCRNMFRMWCISASCTHTHNKAEFWWFVSYFMQIATQRYKNEGKGKVVKFISNQIMLG